MMKKDLKRTQAALAHAGYLFTGYDWTGSARAVAPVARTDFTLGSVADARAARREWKRRALQARQAAAGRRAADSLHERVAAWAHARVPGDPCIGAGC